MGALVCSTSLSSGMSGVLGSLKSSAMVNDVEMICAILSRLLFELLECQLSLLSMDLYIASGLSKG